MADIVFQGARIAGIGLRMAESGPIVRMKVVATRVEEAVAIRFAVPWLHRKTNVLEQLEKGAFVTHDVARIHKWSARSNYVGKFRAFREAEDAPVVGISFLVVCAGQAFEALEHLLRVGEGAGTCTIEAPQAELFEEVELG